MAEAEAPPSPAPRLTFGQSFTADEAQELWEDAERIEALQEVCAQTASLQLRSPPRAGVRTLAAGGRDRRADARAAECADPRDEGDGTDHSAAVESAPVPASPLCTPPSASPASPASPVPPPAAAPASGHATPSSPPTSPQHTSNPSPAPDAAPAPLTPIKSWATIVSTASPTASPNATRGATSSPRPPAAKPAVTGHAGAPNAATPAHAPAASGTPAESPCARRPPAISSPASRASLPDAPPAAAPPAIKPAWWNALMDAATRGTDARSAHPPRALLNQGNTCFANATLQARRRRRRRRCCCRRLQHRRQHRRRRLHPHRDRRAHRRGCPRLLLARCRR